MRAVNMIDRIRSYDAKHGYELYHLYTRVMLEIPDDNFIRKHWDSMTPHQRIQWSYIADAFVRLLRMEN